MKKLIGTEKQVAWANQIRKEVIEKIDYAFKNAQLNEKDLERLASVKEDMENNQAAFWIETFKGNDKVKVFLNYIQEKTQSNRTTGRIAEVIYSKF